MSDEEIVVERSFDVEATVEEAWRDLERLRDERGGGRWWLPGFESTGTVVVAEPGVELRVTKDAEPCAGTVITMTFESIGTGSRIRVTQSGFDPRFVDAAGDGFWAHGARILADTETFFRTGVDPARAWRPWSPLGTTLRDHGHGTVVTTVRDDSWGERVGLAAGDLLVSVAGAPIFTAAEFRVVEQIATEGRPVDAQWIRGRELHRGAAEP